jgi:hypothetical protein
LLISSNDRLLRRSNPHSLFVKPILSHEWSKIMNLATKIKLSIETLDREYRGTLDASTLKCVHAEVRSQHYAALCSPLTAALHHFATEIHRWSSGAQRLANHRH